MSPSADVSASDNFRDIPLTDFLDRDDRPTFIVDLDAKDHHQIVYRNDACAHLEKKKRGAQFKATSHEALDWVTELSAEDFRKDGDLSDIFRRGIHWTGYVLQGRYAVLKTSSKTGDIPREEGAWLKRGEPREEPGPNPIMLGDIVKHGSASSRISVSDSTRTGPTSTTDSTSTTVEDPDGTHHRLLDWTSHKLFGMSSYTKFFRNHSWSQTALGPMSSWPIQLRQLAVMILADPDPRIILWGSELSLVYNEACVAVIGQKHPSALGSGPWDTFGEMWSGVRSFVDLAMIHGKATKLHDHGIMMNRHGFLEETYWTFTMLPIMGPDGRSIGVLDEFTESTNYVISQRRLGTVLQVGERAAAAKSIKDLWQIILSSLESNSSDCPFALFYSVSEDVKDEQSSSAASVNPNEYSGGPKQCHLEGLVGASFDDPDLVHSFELSEGSESFAVPFRKSWETGKPVTITTEEGSLPPFLCKSIDGRGFGDSFKSAVVCPIPPLAGSNILGFLILGLNPRAQYSDDYQQFINLLADRLIKSAAAITLPEEQRRSQAAMEEVALRHSLISEQLMSRTQAAERNEAYLLRLSESIQIGMAVLHEDGTPMYMNQAHLDLCGLDREDFHPSTWTRNVHPDEVEMVSRMWTRMSVEHLPVTYEVRLKGRMKPKDGLDRAAFDGYSWLLCNAIPELDEDSNCTFIFITLTDITHQKWAENLQAQRAHEAVENKRQSEKFIDMTSHEMRNPLSAIIQLSDGILTAASANFGKDKAVRRFQNTVIEDAQTIIFCAQHQKRIVDDILTLSKLDASLLVISPEEVSPTSLVQEAVKMYEAELAKAGVKANILVDQAYTDLSVNKVMVDKSRVLQVLINLFTNAIKFTQSEDRREVSIHISASIEEPTTGPQGIHFIDRRTEAHEHLHTPEWGTGDLVFIQYAVQDTGRGLNEEEMAQLFQRFAQASPKTYGQYGGSGLGLFISKELTELQGGRIGVSSTAGQGSTFVFYVQARRAVPTSNGSPGRPHLTKSPRKRSHDSVESPPVDDGYPFHRLSASNSQQTSPAEGVERPLIPKQPSFSLVEGTISTTLPHLPPTPRTMHSNLHLLVVEDNLINQKVMAQQLRNVGCTVHVAGHGGEALEFLKTTYYTPLPTANGSAGLLRPESPMRQKRLSIAPIADPSSEQRDSVTGRSISVPILPVTSTPPAIEAVAQTENSKTKRKPLSAILMDLEMPVMDGLTCVRRIRDMQQSGQLRGYVPVIAVTANARSEQIAVAINAGMDSVVTKPFRIPELIPQVEELVARIEKEYGRIEEGVDGVHGKKQDGG